MVAAGAVCVSADTLNFEGNICSATFIGDGAPIACTPSSTINQAYGDTAQVNVTYLDVNSGSSLLFWPSGYNNLTNMVWAEGSDSFSFGRITLQLLSPGTITLNSLDMGAHPNISLGTNLRIYDLAGGPALYTYSGNVGNPPAATTFAFSTVSSTSGLVIEWQDSAYNVGMDNVTFTINPASVPEPSSMAILVLGTGGLLGLSRRRARA